MNILTKIFGFKSNSKDSSKILKETEKTEIKSQSENIPPANLFIETEEPSPENNTGEEIPTLITVFLNRNFQSIAWNDGYKFHSEEMLEISKKKIRAEFQLTVDKAIQNKIEKKLQIKNLIIDVSNIYEALPKKLINSIEELDYSIKLLNTQKELSVEDEGWVMTAIHSYQQGFIQGIDDYLAGEELINSIKNV